MSTPLQQPTPPAPQPPGQSSRVTGKAVVLSGTAATGGLVWAGAPWSVVAVVAIFGMVVPGLILTLLIAFPDDSEHKRDIWMAFMRNWDRRAERKRKDRQERRQPRS